MLPDGGPPYAQDLPGAQVPAQIHTATGGGMPGWQITLIVAGAAVLAALLAVTADRTRAARRHTTAPSRPPAGPGPRRRHARLSSSPRGARPDPDLTSSRGPDAPTRKDAHRWVKTRWLPTW